MNMNNKKTEYCDTPSPERPCCDLYNVLQIYEEVIDYFSIKVDELKDSLYFFLIDNVMTDIKKEDPALGIPIASPLRYKIFYKLVDLSQINEKITDIYKRFDFKYNDIVTVGIDSISTSKECLSNMLSTEEDPFYFDNLVISTLAILLEIKYNLCSIFYEKITPLNGKNNIQTFVELSDLFDSNCNIIKTDMKEIIDIFNMFKIMISLLGELIILMISSLNSNQCGTESNKIKS